MSLWLRLILAFHVTSIAAVPWGNKDSSVADKCTDGFKAKCLLDSSSCIQLCGKEFAWKYISEIQKQVKVSGKVQIAIAVMLMLGLALAYCFIVGRIMKLVMYFFMSVSVFCVAILSTPVLKNWAIRQLTRTAD